MQTRKSASFKDICFCFKISKEDTEMTEYICWRSSYNCFLWFLQHFRFYTQVENLRHDRLNSSWKCTAEAVKLYTAVVSCSHCSEHTINQLHVCTQLYLLYVSKYIYSSYSTVSNLPQPPHYFIFRSCSVTLYFFPQQWCIQDYILHKSLVTITEGQTQHYWVASVPNEKDRDYNWLII